MESFSNHHSNNLQLLGYKLGLSCGMAREREFLAR